MEVITKERKHTSRSHQMTFIRRKDTKHAWSFKSYGTSRNGALGEAPDSETVCHQGF